METKQQEHNNNEIPFDLTEEILTRLPVKSLLKFQYVSKTWCSIIRSKDFINSLVSSTQSSRLLISFRNRRLTDKNAENRFFVFTSSQEEDESSSLVATLDMTIASTDAYFYTRSMASVNGFICLSHKGRFMICNPSTRQVITLPEIKITGTNWNSAYKYFGYDPVDHQYKVMLKRVSTFKDDQDHMVLTLGGDKTPSWRQIEGIAMIYCPLTKGICINGIVYYAAVTSTRDMYKIIVCFDVRSERLSFMEPLPSQICRDLSTLINYQGKLAIANNVNWHETYLVFDIWVLQDAKEHQWSFKHFLLDSSCFSSIGNVLISIHGTNKMGELIIAPKFLPRCLGLFYILYYNVVTKEIRKVQLEGLGDNEDLRRRYGIGNNDYCQVYISPDEGPNYNFL